MWFRKRDQRSGKEKGATVAPFCSKKLIVDSPVNQPANSVGEKHVDLARLDKRGHFTGSPDRVAHRLARAISSCLIVRLANHRFGSTLCQFRSIGERTSRAALWTSYSRNQSSLGNRSYHVASLFLTYCAQLFNPVADCVSLSLNRLLLYSLLLHKSLSLKQ